MQSTIQSDLTKKMQVVLDLDKCSRLGFSVSGVNYNVHFYIVTQVSHGLFVRWEYEML